MDFLWRHMQSNRVCHRHSITVSYRPKKDHYENGFLSLKSELLKSLPYSRRISDPKVCNPNDYSWLSLYVSFIVIVAIQLANAFKSHFPFKCIQSINTSNSPYPTFDPTIIRFRRNGSFLWCQFAIFVIYIIIRWCI